MTVNTWKSYVWTANREVVEHCPSIEEAIGSNPVLAWIFFSGFIFQVMFRLQRSLSYSPLYLQFIYKIFRYSQSFIHHHRFIWNQHNDQLPVGSLAQLIEHCSSITEVMGSNSVQARIFSGLIFSTAWVVFKLRRSLSYSLLYVHMYDFHIFTVIT